LRVFASVFLALFFITELPAQTPAFPGALGNGAYVTGGRNGTVYHVTTLADSGAGSFREAVASGNRTVVFDVGGTIKLLTAVSARGNLTIAGQTAPGGIKFDGGEISFSARSNVICRFLRIRPGSDTASSTDDAIAFANGRSMIFDHCSIAFAPWNNVGAVSSAWQTTPVTDITFQHCINANPTGQQFGAHTESVSSDWTWCYNIFANSHNRNPLAKVNNVFINNIEYNCSAGYTTHTSTKFKHDLVNNYFVAGPASGGNFPWYQIDNNQSMYFTGNLYDSDKNGALNGSTTVPLPGYQGGGTVLNSPFSAWTSIIPTMSAALAWRYDLSAAGVLPRDEVDNLILSQIKTLGSGSTGTGAGTVGPGGGLYTSQTQTGLGNNGYGTLTGLAAPTDTDNDGMPDYWELATGSNPNAANPLTNTFTGYTLLENYLNYLAAPHVVTQTNTAVTLNLRQLTEGFSASATYSVTNATNGTVTLISGTNAVFTPAANFIGLGSFNFIVTEGSFSLNVAVTVCVTPVVPPDSAVAFNGALIGVSITTAAVVLPANLTWRGDSGANTWNTSVSNWFNGTGPAAFKNGDIVTFDDTGSTTPAVNLAAAVSPGAFIFDATNNYEIAGSGSLGGSMNLSKYGSGNLTLPNANTFSGGTILNEGTLVLSNLTSLGSGALTLNGGTLSLIAAGGPAIYANPVTVAAPSTIQITGPGNYNEAFNSAFTGSASLDFNIANANGATFSVRSGMTLSGYSGTIFIRGGGPFRWQGGTGSSTVAFDLGTNGAMITRDGGTIILGSLAGGPNTFLRGAGGSAVATTYIIGGKNLSTTFAGQITNGTFAGSPITTAIVKAGTGTLTLSGTNFHTAGTTISNGSLVVSGAINASAVTAVTAGQLTGTGYIGGLVSVNGGGKFSPGNGGPGTFNLGGGLTLNGGTVNFDFANTTTVGGGVNDLIALNGGALTFSGTSTINPSFVNGPLANGTYTLISGGAATVGSTANLTWGGPGGTRQTIALDTATTGALKLNVSGTPAASLVWRGTNGVNWDTATVNWANGGAPDIFYNLDAVTFDDTGVNAASVTLPAPVSPAAIVVNSSQNYTFSGSPITGSGSLTKLGSSTLTLANSNSAFAGTINVFGGTLSAAAGSSLGNGVMTISNGATLALPASGPSVFFGGAITVPANTTGTIISGGLANGISGNLFSGNSNSVLNLNGVSFGGTTSAQFDNFTGTINIQPGSTLRFSPNSSGNTFGSTVPTFVINGTLQPRNAGNTVVLGAFSGTGILASAQSASGTGDTLYVVGGNNSDANFSGNISSNSAVAGSDVDVTKLGTGTLTLSGSSTFGGGTTVSAGTLRVNNTSGSGTGTGDLEIFPGATLTGKGIIASATTLDGGATLAPGDPLGTLTFTTSLALSDSSILQFALGTNSDSVVVVGDLILTGQLQVTNAGGFGPGTYPLFTYGTLSYGNLVIASAPAGYNYTISTNTPGVVQLVVAPTAPPLFGNVSWSAGNLTLSGSNGVPSGNYWVQQSSNLVNWISIATNQFDASGGFSFTTNAPLGSPQNFFRLQLP
jgi:autotransporter-associated beta strand protein